MKEIVYLGTLIRLTRQELRLPKGDSGTEFYDIDQSVGIEMRKTLVPTSHFPDKRALSTCEAALQRTSLICPALQTFDGAQIYAPSRHLERLANLADLEKTLAEDDAC